MTEIAAKAAFLSPAAESLLKFTSDVTLIEGADALTPFMSALDELARNAQDTNPQFEAYALQAAMHSLSGGQKVRVALVWEDKAGEEGKRLLIGAFPYVEKRFYLGLPLKIWSIWTHIHSFIATPHLRKGYEASAIRHFLDYADRSQASMLRFPYLQVGGAFDTSLNEVTQQRGRLQGETDRHLRAFLQSSLQGEAYLDATMRKKKRKEYNRLWNRMNEAGEVRFTTQTDAQSVSEWVDRFLELEARGWKGRRGTALDKRENESAYFRSICEQAAKAGKLHRTELSFDGKAIAMLASFRANEGLYSFKIGFDEAFSRFSPGAMLMLKVIEPFLADESVEWVDSCAIPNHPMIDHIWAERREMRDVNLSTAHPLSRWLVFYSLHVNKFTEFAWVRARAVYHRILKEMNRG